MKENQILNFYTNTTGVEELFRSLSNTSPARICVEGTAGSAKSLIAASLFTEMKNIHLVILPEKEDAAYFYNDLVALLGDDQVFFFPSTYKRSVQYGQTEPANIVLRTEVLNYLSSGKRKGIIVSYPESVMEKVVSKKTLKKNTFDISKGNRISLEFLEDMLHEYRFERVDFVYEPGQYSIRGSIADIFSFSSDMPYRIDFFGEEVDSIRSFNTEDQLSVKILNQVTVIPNIQDISIDIISDTFTDFVPQSSVVWIENSPYIRDKINNIYQQTGQRDDSEIVTDWKEIIITGNHFISQCEKFRIIEFGRQGLFCSGEQIEFHIEPQPAFNKNFELLSNQLQTNMENGYTTWIVSESDSQIERLNDIFAEINPGVVFNPLLINLHGGFTDHDLKIAVYTDHQIFDRYHKFRIRGYFAKKESLSLKELTGLNPGDYVVHIDHGIGRFGGLEKIEVNGKLQEAIKLVYRDNDILYVGIHSLHRISKYKGKDTGEPKI
jgi:transcription-repair coupling factor (superfamily II helicase)